MSCTVAARCKQHLMKFPVSCTVAARCKQHLITFPVSCSVAARCNQHFMTFPVSCTVAARCKQHFMMFPVSCTVAARCKQHFTLLFSILRCLLHIYTHIRRFWRRLLTMGARWCIPRDRFFSRIIMKNPCRALLQHAANSI